MPTERFPFARQEPWSRVLPAAFTDPERAVVEVSDLAISVRYGPFLTTTAWTNVTDVTVTGPFRWFRVIGPHLSLADRGVTYGTATDAGVCVTFAQPVPGLFGSRRVHPGMTVTVADPGALADAVRTHLNRAAPDGRG